MTDVYRMYPQTPPEELMSNLFEPHGPDAPRQVYEVVLPERLHARVGNLELLFEIDGYGTPDQPLRPGKMEVKIDGKVVSGLIQRLIIEMNANSQLPMVSLKYIHHPGPTGDVPVIVASDKE